MSLADFRNLCYFQGNTQILARPWIHRFPLNLRIVVFLMEKSTFWRVHGLVIFGHILLLSHVLANIQNFDVHLRKC